MEDRYNVECCDFIHAHEDIVEKVRGTMPGEDTLYDLTELFRIFADSTRVRILYVLEVRVRPGGAAGHDPIRHLPPAAGTEKRPAGKSPPGRKDRVLLPGRPACQNHSGPGPGAYQ